MSLSAPMLPFGNRSVRGRAPAACYPAVLSDNINLLLRVFGRPAAAMSDILDRCSLLFVSVAVLAVSLLLGSSGLAVSSSTPLLVLSLACFPGPLLIRA